jgi:biopolymer transport protein ExbB
VVIYNHLARVITGYRAVLSDASAMILLMISRGRRSRAAMMPHAAE